MWQVQFASDLHLEFSQNRKYILANPLEPVADILILAGDTLVFTNEQDKPIDESIYGEFLDQISKDFQKVYLLPGNHEYYQGYDLATTLNDFKLPIRDNVNYLNNSSVVINNVKFIFSTLWSYLPRSFPIRSFADFYNCMFNGYRLTIDGYNKAHELSKKYIENEVQNNPRQYKLVIVTHHLPSFDLIDPRYYGSKLNKGFASSNNLLIYKSNAEYWIYGHSHSKTTMRLIDQTKLITNPLGYVHRAENQCFNRSKIIVLD